MLIDSEKLKEDLKTLITRRNTVVDIAGNQALRAAIKLVELHEKHSKIKAH